MKRGIMEDYNAENETTSYIESQEKKKFIIIEKELKRVLADVGSTAVFQFVAKGQPRPEYTWYKNGKQLETDQRIKIAMTKTIFSPKGTKTVQMLKIENVRESDQGLYSVVFRNAYRQTTTQANLYVPKKKLTEGVICNSSNIDNVGVLRQLRNVNIEEGNRITLEVVFRRTPSCVLWFRNNKVIRKDDRIITSVEGTSTSLVVLNSVMTDTGIYYVVGRTSEGIIQSSFADVLVAPVNMSKDKDPSPFLPNIIELPSETGAFQRDVLRIICKAEIDINTEVQWLKNGASVTENSKFVSEDFGGQYIGLKGSNVTTADAGDYTLILQDRLSGREESASCFASITPMNHNDRAPAVLLQRPLRSATACVGSKLVFDCRYALDDVTDFYVVWYVGPFKIERSNSRFSVIHKSGEYLLYVKKLEPEMAGAVVCELRRVLHNQKTVPVCSTTAHLAIVPSAVLEEELLVPHLENRRIYNDDCPGSFKHTSLDESPDTDAVFDGEDYLDISYSRLDEDNIFFLHAAKRNIDVNILCEERPSLNSAEMLWNDNLFPRECWFAISVGQNDGSFIEVGVTSAPVVSIRGSTPDTMTRIRVRAVPTPANGYATSLISIEIPDEEVLVKLLKSDMVRTMEDFMAEYSETGQLLGYGAFGSVVLARDRANKHYAVKFITLDTQESREKAEAEYEIMKSIHHSKLVQLVEGFSGETAFVIVMEHLSGGELFDRIVQEENITEEDVVKYMKQICEALSYLHDRNIVHLDVKPENIICLSPNSCQVKLIDFGLATVLDGRTTRVLHGTRYYMAPEVLNYDGLTLACDMWSVGVVAYCLLSGQLPFEGETWAETSAKITSANYNYNDVAFRDISRTAKNFVNKLLLVRADTRMSAKEALQHDWLKKGPPKKDKPENMKRTQTNMKSYLLAYRSKWQKAGHVMIAAHRLRMHAGVREEQRTKLPNSF